MVALILESVRRYSHLPLPQCGCFRPQFHSKNL